MADDAPISLKPMIDAQLALLVHGNAKTDAREYRRSWPDEVRPLQRYRDLFPNVVTVDRGIPLDKVAERADIDMETSPSVFGDVPKVIETTAAFHRYVIYVDDGHRSLRKAKDEEPTLPQVEALPLTLREGMFAVLHHGRIRGWKHGLICEGSHDAFGRFPVIAATNRGYLLTSVRPQNRLFRFAVARRGTIIPASM